MQVNPGQVKKEINDKGFLPSIKISYNILLRERLQKGRETPAILAIEITRYNRVKDIRMYKSHDTML